jgi:hypothetical protein
MAASATFSILAIDESRFCRWKRKSATSATMIKATAATMMLARTAGDMDGVDVFESPNVEEEFVGYDDEITVVISLAAPSFRIHRLTEKFPRSCLRLDIYSGVRIRSRR